MNNPISKDDLLYKTDNGLSIFKRYIPEPFILGKAFKSPLREDIHPSFSVFKDPKSGKYLFKDFGRDEHKGDAISFVMLRFNIQFIDAIHKVADDFGFSPTFNVAIKTTDSNIQIQKKELGDNELRFFKPYGISKEILERYNVKALDFYKANTYTTKSTPEKPIIYYHFQWGGKIYNPFNNKYRFMYVGQKPDLYIFGQKQLDETAKLLIITGGEKDVLTYRTMGLNAICFNSETANISPKVIKDFQKQFKYIAVSFDVDITGDTASNELCNKYNLIKIKLPLSGKKQDKDISDFVKNGHTKQELMSIIDDSIDKKFDLTLRILRKHTFDERRKVEKPIPALTIGNNNILSLGNFMVLAGKVKTGKSSVLYSIISGAIIQQNSQADTLGINIQANPDQKAVLHFDTEQSNYDWHTRILQSFERAQINKKPSFFNSYHILEFTLSERLQYITEMIEYNHRQHNGIHLIVIDGVADLVKSVNDEEKSNEVVDLFHQLAGIYNCPIILVVHLNPDGNKTRGHLGSQLDRKAESVIIIEREGEICSINPKYCRNANAIDIPIMQFRWDKELNQHVSIGSKSVENKIEKQIDEYNDVLDEIFTNDVIEISKKDFKDLLSEKLNLKRSSIYSIVNFMLQENLVQEQGLDLKNKLIVRTK